MNKESIMSKVKEELDKLLELRKEHLNFSNPPLLGMKLKDLKDRKLIITSRRYGKSFSRVMYLKLRNMLQEMLKAKLDKK